MKSKTSLFNKAIFRHNIKAYWPLWGGLCVYYLVLVVMMCYRSLFHYSYYIADAPDKEIELMRRLDQQEMVIGIINRVSLTPMVAIFALITGILLFSYLFTPRNANMLHTFPISRKSLFCTNYVSGLLFLILPMAVNVLIAFLLCKGQGIDTQGMCGVSLLAGIGESFFFYSVTLVVIFLVGNTPAAVFLYGILNFLYSGICLILYGLTSAICYGLEDSGELFTDSLTSVLTPVICMGNEILISRIYNEAGTAAAYSFQGKGLLLGYVAAGVAFTIIAYILYQKRQLERAGDVLTVNWVKPIFRWGAAFCGGVLAALFLLEVCFQTTQIFGLFLLFTLLTGGICFFLVQMLLEKSFKVFNRKRIYEAGAFLVCICIVYMGVRMDIFGVENKLPSVEETAYVKIDNIIEDSPEEIAKVREIHKSILDAKESYRKYSYGYNNDSECIYLTWYLKNGEHFSRRYWLPPEEIAASGAVEKVKAWLSQPGMTQKEIFGPHYETLEPEYGFIIGAGEEETRISVSASDAKLLYQAILQDMERQENDSDYDSGEDVNYADPQLILYFPAKQRLLMYMDAYDYRSKNNVTTETEGEEVFCTVYVSKGSHVYDTLQEVLQKTK